MYYVFIIKCEVWGGDIQSRLSSPPVRLWVSGSRVLVFSPGLLRGERWPVYSQHWTLHWSTSLTSPISDGDFPSQFTRHGREELQARPGSRYSQRTEAAARYLGHRQDSCERGETSPERCWSYSWQSLHITNQNYRRHQSKIPSTALWRGNRH